MWQAISANLHLFCRHRRIFEEATTDGGAVYVPSPTKSRILRLSRDNHRPLLCKLIASPY